jgi:hypothetical protein
MLHRRNAGCEYWLWKVKNRAGCIATSTGRMIACRLPENAFQNTHLYGDEQGFVEDTSHNI